MVDTVDDSTDFMVLKSALDVCDFSASDQEVSTPNYTET